MNPELQQQELDLVSIESLVPDRLAASRLHARNSQDASLNQVRE
jgi:hypothetical protein